MDLIAYLRTTPLTCIACKMPGYPFLDVHGFANIYNGATRVVEIIHAAFDGKFIELLLGKIRWQDRFSRILFQRLENLIVAVALQKLIKDPYSCCSVSTGAVTVLDRDPQAFRQTSKTVRPQSGNDLTAEAHSTQLFRLPLNAGLLRFFFQEGIIEMCNVSHKHFTVKFSVDVGGEFLKGRSGKNHLGCYSCEARDVIGNVPSWINQRVKRVCYLNAIVIIDGYLRNAMI